MAIAAFCHGTGRGRIAVTIAVEYCGIHRSLPGIAAAIDVEMAMEYTVAIPWVAMVGTPEVATDRTAARAMATTVVLAVQAPRTV